MNKMFNNSTTMIINFKRYQICQSFYISHFFSILFFLQHQKIDTIFKNIIKAKKFHCHKKSAISKKTASNKTLAIYCSLH